METDIRLGRRVNVKGRLRSRMIDALLSDRSQAAKRFTAECKRRLLGRTHDVSVFLQLDDPYSYLLSRYLPAVAEEYDVVFRLYLAQAIGDEFRPAPELMSEYGLRDCRLLANELGIPFLDKGEAPVVEHRRALLNVLAGEHDSDAFAALLSAALTEYWRGNVEAVARLVGRSTTTRTESSVVSAGRKKLRSLGHYDTAMMYYAGEWYRGVDRLHYLLDRLQALGLQQPGPSRPELRSVRQAMQLKLPATPPASARNLPALEFFFSFRSPYSYLALQRTFDIADAYRLTLTLRPVLPMVMRGLAVPDAKLAYIARDAKREANRNAIPFGRVCDPLGTGVERCLAVFLYAQEQRKAREFLLAVGAGIWSQGIDVATDRGMREVTEHVGLFWPEVVKAMGDSAWRTAVEDNQTELEDAGLWGVPAYRFGSLDLWGQDRLWLLARQIEDRFHDGEGILV